LKVFLDNNLSPYLARALHTLLEPEGDQIVHLTDRFEPNIEDRVDRRARGRRRLGRDLRRSTYSPQPD
jgi:hypothetical protein